MNGTELLAKYRRERSEEAFAEVVRRYQDLVFSVARRRLGSEALARDAAQTVFLRLAQNTGEMREDTALLGWLHRTTVHVAIDLWRAETRREARERKAFAMHENPEGGASESVLRPEVDEALHELDERDRSAILHRFFDGKSMRETGAALGISEDAAKMRVSRSLERLRERLALRGIRCSAAALGGLLAEQAVSAVPAGALAGLSFAAVSAGARRSVFEFLRPRLAPRLAVVVAGLGTIALLTVAVKRGSSEAEAEPSASANARSERLAETVEPAVPVEEEAVSAEEPDARKMLEAVARARNRLLSGDLQFEMSTEMTSDGLTKSNDASLRVVFDGAKRRFEQVGTEYRYTKMGEAGERDAQSMREQKMSRAAAVEAGLLQPFEARDVTIDDGTVFLKYRETDGRSDGTSIDDRSKGISSTHFDPRALGFYWADSSVEECLFLGRAERFSIIGQEDVEGTLCWRIRAEGPQFGSDYWVSTVQPERLLKHQIGGKTALSRFQSTHPNDPLPTEVLRIDPRGDSSIVSRLKRIRSEYNLVVDPAFCTLAGLGMQPGTPVSDSRIMRHIGYWDGSGLAESSLAKSQTNAVELLTLAEVVPVLDAEPGSERGLQAAEWILFNTPDGPEVERAGEAILRHHIQSTNLLALCTRLESLRHRCAKPILREALAQNPDAEIRARACFSLGEIWKDEARYGNDKAATQDARAYYQRVLSEFPNAGQSARQLVFESRRELDEIDRMFIGNPAPELEGVDLSGEKFRLSNLRGRVVFVVFWSGSGYSEAEEHKKLAALIAGKPVSIVGVAGASERERALKIASENEIPWPILWDDRSGPIQTAWAVRSWTSTYLIDQNGIIRQRGLRWPQESSEAIEALLRGN